MLGSGALSLAPTGLWPIGRLSGAILPGLGICTSWPGSGWACAAAPEHPSAAAGGAVMPAHSTGTSAHAVHDFPGADDTRRLPFTATARRRPV